MSMINLTINFLGSKLLVRVAKTKADMSKGLSGVFSLQDNEGMLFDFGNAQFANFWMKDTHLPLDIAYIDDCMRIVKIDRMLPHVGKSHCEIPILYAVETNAGWFDKNNVKVGCEMSIGGDEPIRGIVDEIMEEMWHRPTCFSDIVYRPFSDMFFQKIREMKERVNTLNEGIIPFDKFTREALDTDIGEFGVFEGTTVPLDIPIPDVMHDELYEAKKPPKGAKIGQPRRGGGGSGGKFHVYVRDPKTKNIKKVSFGAKGMSVGINNPKRRKSFVARHNCEKANDRTTASYWSCRLPRYWKQLGLKKTSFKFW